jgi:preprotein translocase subunit SecD
MLKVSKITLLFSVVVCFLGLLFSLPGVLPHSVRSILPHFLQGEVSLGLELRGGSHLRLLVDTKSFEYDRQREILDEFREKVRKSKARYESISVKQVDGSSMIVVTMKDESDFDVIKKIMLDVEKSLIVSKVGTEARVVFSNKFSDDLARMVVNESIEVVRRRIDESGTKEPTILRQGRDMIVLQFPGVDSPSEIKKLIGRTALLTFHAVDDTLDPVVSDGSAEIKFPHKLGVIYLPLVKSGSDNSSRSTTYIPVKKQVSLTGKSLQDAQMSVDPQSGSVCVSVVFDSVSGTRKMAELSSKYLHKQFAIVLDEKVLSAPVFQSVINNGRAQITGSFNMEEATELALLLRTGSLPAPLNVIEERTVGPSLGEDSISSGKRATIISFILVSLFMVLAYGRFGGFSIVSLSFNIILLIAWLILFGATLTLPGIAGIALTIGMAVDSNVLIYERIREEIRRGIRPESAVAKGYKVALSTILDSNITTLIGTLVLYEYGSGPIRGFALTLATGTVISLFSSFSLTKTVMSLWLRFRKKPIVV